VLKPRWAIIYFLFLLCLAPSANAEIAQTNWGNNKISYLKQHVNFWHEYFSVREKELFQRQIARGKKYEKTIKKILRAQGVPEDIFYVGLIESGYSTTARSSADAVGPWQFMKGTAINYGLRVNQQIDERKNIIKSTQAAARYFADLYNIFGSWEMALCAYNRGEYGVIRSIRKANSRDYLVLIKKGLLPEETGLYIPKMLAAQKIYDNPEHYGLNVNTIEGLDDDQFILARFHRSVSMKALAQQLQIDLKKLQDLNPDVRVDRLQADKKPIALIVPKHTSVYLQSLNTSQSAPVREKNHGTYRVKSGELLHKIARDLGVAEKELVELNGLRIQGKIEQLKAGQELIVPL
jgi:membrane-bound lytic murein transglycosylase D